MVERVISSCHPSDSILAGVVLTMPISKWSCFQAYREGEEDQTLAGLVPSKSFWENREQIRLKILADSKEAETQTLCCPTRRKKKKSQFNADEGG